MSRSTMLRVPFALVALLLSSLGLAPAANAASWPPPAPTVSDVCGVKQDQFYIQKTTDVQWKDSSGNSLSSGAWYPSGGAASVTVTAQDTTTFNGPTQSYPMSFDNRSDSSCQEMADTVSTQIGACDQTGTTGVAFTYVNTDDASDWWHTNPRVHIVPVVTGADVTFTVTGGRVNDGASVTVTHGTGVGDDFRIASGTYRMILTTNETGSATLPNTFFVPTCAGQGPPRGDPGYVESSSGPNGSGAVTVSSVSATRASGVATLNNTASKKARKFTVITKSKGSKAVRRSYRVKAGRTKTVRWSVKLPGTVKVTVSGHVIGSSTF